MASYLCKVEVEGRKSHLVFVAGSSTRGRNDVQDGAGNVCKGGILQLGGGVIGEALMVRDATLSCN